MRKKIDEKVEFGLWGQMDGQTTLVFKSQSRLKMIKDIKLIKLTKIKSCCLTENSQIVCPCSQSSVTSYKLPEILVTVVEEVLDPKWCLGQVQQRFGDFITYISMISGFVRYLHQSYLICYGVVPTVTCRENICVKYN